MLDVNLVLRKHLFFSISKGNHEICINSGCVPRENLDSPDPSVELIQAVYTLLKQNFCAILPKPTINMNAVFAAVLLAFVATCSGTQVVSTLGGSQLYYSAQPAYQYQYVNPSSSIQYVQQPYVASSSVVQSSVPVTYANQAVIPSTYNSVYGLQYPYAYGYGYSLLKK